MMNIDDEEDDPKVPDITDDEDMLIQEKIMQSKSELISKLNAQENVANLIKLGHSEITNGLCSYHSDVTDGNAGSSCSSDVTNGSSTHNTDATNSTNGDHLVKSETSSVTNCCGENSTTSTESPSTSSSSSSSSSQSSSSCQENLINNNKQLTLFESCRQ